MLEQIAVLQSINTSQEEKKKEKKKSISSIHPSFVKMILFTSSEDGTDAPTDPSGLCSDFFEQKPAIHAQVHLDLSLTVTFSCPTFVSTPLAIALFHVDFQLYTPAIMQDILC